VIDYSEQIRQHAHDLKRQLRERNDPRIREIDTLRERANALRTRTDARLDEATRGDLVTTIVSLDKQDTPAKLRAKHDAYLVGLAIGAIEREIARAHNDLMDSVYEQAEREVGRAARSHADFRVALHDMRRRGASAVDAARADSEDRALASMSWGLMHPTKESK
jgi:hypothetical protein